MNVRNNFISNRQILNASTPKQSSQPLLLSVAHSLIVSTLTINGAPGQRPGQATEKTFEGEISATHGSNDKKAIFTLPISQMPYITASNVPPPNSAEHQRRPSVTAQENKRTKEDDKVENFPSVGSKWDGTTSSYTPVYPRERYLTIESRLPFLVSHYPKLRAAAQEKELQQEVQRKNVHEGESKKALPLREEATEKFSQKVEVNGIGTSCREGSCSPVVLQHRKNRRSSLPSFSPSSFEENAGLPNHEDLKRDSIPILETRDTASGKSGLKKTFSKGFNRVCGVFNRIRRLTM